MLSSPLPAPEKSKRGRQTNKEVVFFNFFFIRPQRREKKTLNEHYYLPVAETVDECHKKALKDEIEILL